MKIKKKKWVRLCLQGIKYDKYDIYDHVKQQIKLSIGWSVQKSS